MHKLLYISGALSATLLVLLYLASLLLGGEISEPPAGNVPLSPEAPDTSGASSYCHPVHARQDAAM